MMTDKSLLFFDNLTATGSGTAKEVKGSDYARSFIFCTIASGVTALKLEVKTGATSVGATTVIATKTATQEELDKGLMALPMPHDVGDFVNVAATVTGTAASGMVCGITDAIPNGQFVK